MKQVRIAAFLLAALTVGSALTACGDDAQKQPVQTTPTGGNNGESTAAETEAPDPFADFDFGGAAVRMLVSANDYDSRGSSIYTIRHEESSDADIVRDAVYKRNMKVEQLLNIKFEFTENTDDYTTIPTTIRQLVTAGDNAYELIIHDLFPLASLSVEGSFLNVKEGQHFDFTQPWWYTDYMEDLAFGVKDTQYLLAGDYFMDILRTAHALYFNKDLFRSLYETPDELYQHVLDGTWTQEVFLNYVKDAYNDTNGDGKADDDDIYGYGHVGTWGSAIPWIISSDLTFIKSESDGHPVFAMNNERSVLMLERLNDIFWNTASHDYAEIGKNTEAFISGKVLFGGYQRVSSLEVFRDMTAEIGVVPYPKMDAAQEHYVTSSHDTANVGAIPMTCDQMDMMSAVLEVLSRETYDSVMPAYYETALKVKYSRDDTSSQMLDIIRANISCVFPVAYGNYCMDMPLQQAFCTPLGAKRREFASNYEKKVKGAQKKLDQLWEAFSSIDQ